MSLWFFLPVTVGFLLGVFLMTKVFDKRMFWVFLLIGCCLLGVALWASGIFSLNHLTKVEKVKKELAVGTNTLNVDIAKGTYVLKIGEDLAAGQQPTTQFSAHGIINTGQKEIPFKAAYDPSGDYAAIFEHFRFGKSQGSTKITVTLQVGGEHPPIYAWCFPVK